MKSLPIVGLAMVFVAGVILGIVGLALLTAEPTVDVGPGSLTNAIEAGWQISLAGGLVVLGIGVIVSLTRLKHAIASIV